MSLWYLILLSSKQSLPASRTFLSLHSQDLEYAEPIVMT